MPTSQKQYSTVQYSTAHLTEAGAAVHNLQTQAGVGKAASEDLRRGGCYHHQYSEDRISLPAAGSRTYQICLYKGCLHLKKVKFDRRVFTVCWCTYECRESSSVT